MPRTAVKILEAKIGIQSNKKECLLRFPSAKEVESLLTDFRCVDECPFSSYLDGYIVIKDTDSEPSYKISGSKVLFRGPFTRLSKKAADKRFTLWGNQGFLYRYALYILEKYHGILNLHACVLYHENKDILYVITGGPGSGKTVFLLSGLQKGLKLFSTETAHVRADGKDMTWFKGPLLDNIRWGTLIHDFPEYLPEKTSLSPEKAWTSKVALDLSPFQTETDKISNPQEIHIIFPRIEEGRKKCFLNPIKNMKEAAKKLFDNISQKLTETVVLYDSFPVLGLDEQELAILRLAAVDRLLRHPSIKKVASMLSTPKKCWESLFTTAEES